ncbi:winged helix-turn-helix transcriptional regulator [archaeon]|nr:winged helix-turn-helix transcriptional regulator [archaeon]NCP79357.1 winged helix-turn-helix transcriptional regulator [archaeon]NCP97300.1 winged helix-turn-helix transcriptional regulator [archaeon]NCQ07124.1 winged helix-turn-helix transcriptional regulator [archaeon]NCQ50920.1 winged helix-turn-helix transcriptional regulator [archaeon]
MTEEKILIDRETLKAIASDTRLDILKSLSKRKKTLSELSKVLDLKSPTIKEHLDHLINSNLVLKEETESKWKYYSLTDKGSKLIKPREIKVLISFVVSFISTLGLIGLYLIKYVFSSSKSMMASSDSIASDMIMSKSIEETIMDTASQTVSQEISQAPPMIISNTSNNTEILMIIAIGILLSLTVFSLILLIKDKQKRKKECVSVID